MNGDGMKYEYIGDYRGKELRYSREDMLYRCMFSENIQFFDSDLEVLKKRVDFNLDVLPAIWENYVKENKGKEIYVS